MNRAITLFILTTTMSAGAPVKAAFFDKDMLKNVDTSKLPEIIVRIEGRTSTTAPTAMS
jgi:hypothetical protein